MIALSNPNDDNIKLCQSCIERGYKPPNTATREWQSGMFYCDECFDSLIQNMTGIPVDNISNEIKRTLANTGITNVSESNESNENGKKYPLLQLVYDKLNIPPELRYTSIDTVCRNHEQFFNFSAPSVVNKTIEELASVIEEMACIMFVVKYLPEPHELQIKKLKAERRKENNLSNLDDSKEEYAKVPKSSKGAISKTQEKQLESLAKAMGITVEQARDNLKKARERDFNRLVGNCPDCGEAKHDGKCNPNVKSISIESSLTSTTNPVKQQVKLTSSDGSILCRKAYLNSDKKAKLCSLTKGHDGNHD